MQQFIDYYWDEEKEEKFLEKKIKFIPLWKWLLE
jgi:hypothetical protein